MRNSEFPPISRRWLLGIGICAIPAGRRLLAGQFQSATQTPQASEPPRLSAPGFSAEVKVVNVFATVRDKKGKIVRDLTKDDFTVSEDRRPQTIRYFARQSDLPLTLGLLVDTSGSERRMMGTERQASYTFFDQVLRPDRDKAFLIHFDREVELLQDVTSSRERLQKALGQLEAPQWGSHSQDGSGGDPNGNSGDSGNNGGWGGGGRGRPGGGQRSFHGGTTLYDAIYLASNDLMKKQSGRKALVLLTDGVDRGSKVSLSEAIDSAQRADTLVYSVRIYDEEGFSSGFPGGMGRHGGLGGGPWGGGGMGGHRGGYPQASRPDGKKTLEQISKETGGAYFEASKKKNINDIYSEIEEELRNQYSLGYTPEKSAEPGFRKLQVTVKKKGYTVQARDGYYAGASS
jgi:VWFA-related protein